MRRRNLYLRVRCKFFNCFLMNKICCLLIKKALALVSLIFVASLFQIIFKNYNGLLKQVGLETNKYSKKKIEILTLSLEFKSKIANSNLSL